MNELFKVKEICDKLMADSSRTGKEKILEENKDNELFKKVLKYTYDTNLKFKISKKTIKAKEGQCKWNTLFDMLDELAESNINNDLRNNVYAFLYNLDEELRSLVINIMSKDLKCGISIKTINKVYPNLIFDFQVMKASAYDEKNKKVFDKKAKQQGYMLMIKENGERGIVIKENGKVSIVSRQNKAFEGLVDLESSFKDLPDNFVYEGELLAFEPNGNAWQTSEDQFKLTNQILHTKGDKHGIYISLFDAIPLDNFKEGVYDKRAIDRKAFVCKLIEEYNKSHDDNLIQFCQPLQAGNDIHWIDKVLNNIEKYGNNQFRVGSKEGLMVQLNDSIYEAKRVKTSLKVKKWHTMDLKVIGLKESVEKPNTLGSLVVDFKGEEQGVSGFTDELKELWWNNPDEIIGRVIEVKYKAITKDKESKESLQFCQFIRVREEGKEVSYN